MASTHTYAVGDIAYWPPGPNIAIYYDHDGEIIPDPGVIIIGKLGTGVEALNVPGSLKVIIELMNQFRGRLAPSRATR